MISVLEGEILSLHPQSIDILLSSGIGYEVFVTEIILSQLQIGEKIRFYIYHQRTENSENLFGFLEAEDKTIFQALLKISGVGGKVALQILSLGRNMLISACKQEDNKTIESIKGVGKKMAEKIILELKDKDFAFEITDVSKQQEVPIQTPLFDDIITTLVNMGYLQKDIQRVLQDLPDELQDPAEIIPHVIKHLH